MEIKTFTYPFTVKEVYLDILGHINNATYLILFEEARWDLITKNGYGLKKILETGISPVVLEVHIRYLKELRLREEVVIESQVVSYEKKVGKMIQKMIRDGEECCTAEFTFGLFDLKKRALLMPTPEWLKGLGIG